jgi:hypothetical protein
MAVLGGGGVLVARPARDLTAPADERLAPKNLAAAAWLMAAEATGARAKMRCG